jgi:hypothetical protein
MTKYQLYTRKKNNRDIDKLVAECVAKSVVDAKKNFEAKGYNGTYLIGSYAMQSVMPVILRSL